ncbi:MAG: UDP-N-acetylmuramyl-tripeptide synthetase [Nitrospirota bacterium]
MNLQRLVHNLKQRHIIGSLDLEITNIATHSKKVNAGSLFICIEGFKVDGHNYIDEAIQRGAKAVLVSRDVTFSPSVTYIKVPDTRQAIPIIADIFYDHPSSKLKLIGITGTNGKTTTAYLIESILNTAGYIPTRISTITTKIGNTETLSDQTTPEALELQGILAQAVKAGSTHVVMEVSSHALALHRTSGCKFDTAIFTNITPEHLDFHLTQDDYLAAKLKLFKTLSSFGTAIINIDDAHSPEVIANTEAKTITYGLSDKAQYYADNIESTKVGTSFFLSVQG